MLPAKEMTHQRRWPLLSKRYTDESAKFVTTDRYEIFLLVATAFVPVIIWFWQRISDQQYKYVAKEKAAEANRE